MSKESYRDYNDVDGPVEIRNGKERRASDDDSYDDEGGAMCGNGPLDCLKKNLFLLLLLVGVIAGVVTGVLIRKYHPDWSDDDLHGKRVRMYLLFMGELFLRMLKCMIIPLIVSSLISGMAGLPGKSRGKIGGYAVLYYMITTFIAVIIGVILVSTIKPGEYAQRSQVKKDRVQEPADFILDLIRNVFPNNIIAATFEQTKTDYVLGEENITINGTVNGTETVIKDFMVVTGGGTNVLGLVVFSIVLGIILGQMDEKGRPLKECIDSLMLAIIEMVRLIIWFAPIGICFLLAERIVRMQDPLKEFTGLAVYMGTVIAGLAIHAIIILPLIYFAFVRKNPFKFALNMMQALVLALGTASSSATLPVTMKCMREKARVDARIAGFVLPVGATINMDGTALYEAVASIFIAQYNNIPLNIGETITICITATAAAIGAAGVPEAGLVTMAIVLTAVGLPVEDVGLILAVDWLLDRFRTCVNVWGDSIGCGVVEALAKDQLRKMDAEELEEERKNAIEYSPNGSVEGKRESGIGHHNPVYSAHPDDMTTL